MVLLIHTAVSLDTSSRGLLWVLPRFFIKRRKISKINYRKITKKGKKDIIKKCIRKGRKNLKFNESMIINGYLSIKSRFVV